jgi:hypothetical protein
VIVRQLARHQIETIWSIDRSEVHHHIIHDVAAEVQVLHIDGERMALELDRSSAAHAHTARAASVVHVVYAVTGAVALQIAEQPAVTLHPADAFVFHPRAVADRLGANVGLRGLAAHAEVVVATLVFGSDITC